MSKPGDRPREKLGAFKSLTLSYGGRKFGFMKTAQIVNGYFKHLLTNINFLLKIVIIGPTDS